MVNSGRMLNKAIFTISEPVVIAGVTLETGFQQLSRIDDKYYFNKLGQQTYAVVPVTMNADVLKALFSRNMFFS